MIAVRVYTLYLKAHYSDAAVAGMTYSHLRRHLRCRQLQMGQKVRSIEKKCLIGHRLTIQLGLTLSEPRLELFAGRIEALTLL